MMKKGKNMNLIELDDAERLYYFVTHHCLESAAGMFKADSVDDYFENALLPEDRGICKWTPASVPDFLGLLKTLRAYPQS